MVVKPVKCVIRIICKSLRLPTGWAMPSIDVEYIWAQCASEILHSPQQVVKVL